MGQGVIRLNAKGPVKMLLRSVQVSQEKIASTYAVMCVD
jgi:hypothetical protein